MIGTYLSDMITRYLIQLIIRNVYQLDTNKIFNTKLGMYGYSKVRQNKNVSKFGYQRTIEKKNTLFAKYLNIIQYLHIYLSIITKSFFSALERFTFMRKTKDELYYRSSWHKFNVSAVQVELLIDRTKSNQSPHDRDRSHLQINHNLTRVKQAPRTKL